MGKQKQQVISRFFAPKPNPNPNSSSANPPTPPPRVQTTVSWPPSKTRAIPFDLAGQSKNSPSQLAGKNRTPPDSSQFSPKSPIPPHKKPKVTNVSISPPQNANPVLLRSTDPSRHRKFVKKLLEEPVDRSPSGNITGKVPSDNRKYTPLEQQVVELKAKYPDVLLMVEVGYKFRFFGEDAEVAARVLGIYAHNDHNFLTASIPTFRLNVHVRRLVSAGFKVGLVKQTETAAIKAHGTNKLGPFLRGLSALYTKATLEAAEEMGSGELGDCSGFSNYLLCVVEKSDVIQNRDCGLEANFDTVIGLVAVEISTGDVIYGQFNDGIMRAGLESALLSLSPTELLLGAPLSSQSEKLLLAYAGPKSNVRVERTSRNCFDDGGALAEVLSLYGDMDEHNSILEHHEEQTAETLQEGKHHRGIEGIMAMPVLPVQALALTISYLKEFGFERILCLGASFRPLCSNVEMTLSSNALQQLEVLKNNSDGSVNGSLLHLMNHTLTAFGSRLLKHWVTHPLCDRHLISTRLDAVSEIAESMGACQSSRSLVDLDEEASPGAIQIELSDLLSSVLTTLGRSPDVQRGITRIFHRTATPFEFIAVIHSLLFAGKQLQHLHLEDENDNGGGWKTVRSILLRRLILTASSSIITGHAAKLLSALNKEAANQRDLQNLFIICNGQFPEVARGHASVTVAEEKLDSLIGLYRKKLGIHNLEFMSVSGATHLIELPSDVRVPLNWVKVNSTKKMIRYHPPEVLTALDGLLLAKEELAVACRATWDSFLMGFTSHYAEFQAAVQALAALDCLHSLAILSRNKGYVCPIFVGEDEPCQIEIRSGRHPVLESILQDGFVPNDTNLHVDGEYCQIIMGPNMGGKSCYIRQVALIALMAQMRRRKGNGELTVCVDSLSYSSAGVGVGVVHGNRRNKLMQHDSPKRQEAITQILAQVGSFVPTASAKLHVLDGIYTRMGASDSIQHGSSTFFEELSEVSHILHNCTSRSLVIIDELGRGTSTHDGVAIAYATLHHLLEQKKCMVLFVTHYPKIVDIMDEFPGSIGAYHVSYLTAKKAFEITEFDSDRSVETPDHGDITFLYTIVLGVSDKSFGLNVARLAQLPSSCIDRAAVMAAKLEAEVSFRVESRLTGKLLPDKAAHLDMPRFSLLDCTVGALAPEEVEEELAKACHELFFHLQSALADADPVNSFSSLEEARKLALKATTRYEKSKGV